MREDSLLPPRWPGGWPPSNYPILLAILLLLATALAIVAATDAVADRLATYAYLALVVGVGLRLVEHLGRDGLRSALAAAVGRIETRLRPAAAAVRRVDHRGVVPDDRTSVNEVARYTVLATLAGGLLIVGYWWWQPATAVGEPFLLAWTLAVWLLASAAVASR